MGSDYCNYVMYDYCSYSMYDYFNYSMYDYCSYSIMTTVTTVCTSKYDFWVANKANCVTGLVFCQWKTHVEPVRYYTGTHNSTANIPHATSNC